MRNGQLFFDTLILIEFGRNFDFSFKKHFRSDSGGRFSMILGRSVGRSVGQALGRSVPRPPLAPKEVWSGIASSVWELCLVWRRLIMG